MDEFDIAKALGIVRRTRGNEISLKIELKSMTSEERGDKI